MQNNTCFCVLTHIITLPLLERIERLNREIKCADFWLIIDGNQYESDLLSDINVFYINRNDLFSTGIANKNTQFPKNIDRLLMYFAYIHNDYDYYYFMENDVMYFGNYNEFISKYINNTDDVLLQNDKNYIGISLPFNKLYELYDNNYGKPSIETAFPNCISEMRINNKSAISYPYKRIFQIMRFSKKFINTYIDLIKNDKIAGHFEWAYIACLLEYKMTFSVFDEVMYTFFEPQDNFIKYKLDLIDTLHHREINNAFIHHKYNLTPENKIS